MTDKRYYFINDQESYLYLQQLLLNQSVEKVPLQNMKDNFHYFRIKLEIEVSKDV